MQQQINKQERAVSAALLIARISIAGLMLTHGIPKLMMLLSGGEIQFPPVFGMSPQLSLILTVGAEVFGSILLLAGFLTRFATIPLIITMAVAAFIIHAADPLAVKEPALLYLAGYMVLLVAGAGKYSIDYLLQERRVPAQPVRTINKRSMAI